MYPSNRLLINQRILSLTKLVFFNFLIFVILRSIFYFAFFSEATEFADSAIFKALYLGLKFDMRLACLLVAPAFILGFLPFLNPIKIARKFWIYFYALVFSVWFTLYLCDFGHYAYVNTRLNGTVLQHLNSPDIAFKMVWQTYPVGWGVLALALIAWIYKSILQKFIFVEFEHKNISARSQVLSYIFFILIFACGIHGKFSQYPLRWSEAFFSQNTFISAFALNPILYLAETYKYQSPIYDIEKVKKYYPIMADYLGVPPEQQNIATLNFVREVVNTPKVDFKPNVLVVVMESMAMAKTNLTDNPLEITPHLKKIAEEGYYFDQYYVPSEGTARSMFGLTTSVPDVSGYKTASRNPMIVDQNVVANYFTDYEKFYFLGGNANWGQIRSVFTNNIKGIHVVEEGQFEAPVTDVWGISDLDLFKEVHKKLLQLKPGQNFFGIIQTAGFHRPYTIPDDRGDFEVKTLSESDYRRGGFISNDEYNSLRFSDYALGEFIQLFKNSPYAENTILVVTGDHGLPDENAPHIPFATRELQIEKFHVPLVFYFPKYLKEPQKDSRLVVETDVMASIANLAGVSFTNTAFGRDLFNPEFDKMRVAFTYTHYTQPPHYGMIYDNHYYLVRGQKEELFSLDPNQSEIKDISDQNPELRNFLKEMTHAYYETAKYILYNNKKPEVLTTVPPSPQGN